MEALVFQLNEFDEFVWKAPTPSDVVKLDREFLIHMTPYQDDCALFILEYTKIQFGQEENKRYFFREYLHRGYPFDRANELKARWTIESVDNAQNSVQIARITDESTQRWEFRNAFKLYEPQLYLSALLTGLAGIQESRQQLLEDQLKDTQEAFEEVKEGFKKINWQIQNYELRKGFNLGGGPRK